jgi:hypothetical protein
MALDTLLLALLLGATADAPQAHAAPQTHAAPAKPDAKPEPKADAKTESKTGHEADTKAVAEAKPADVKQPAAPKTADAKAPEAKTSEGKAASKPSEPSAGKNDLAKLVADLTAVREAAAKSRAMPATSKPRSVPRPATARPSLPRYRLRWPSFDERWRVSWPLYAPDRLALVWPD